VRLEPEAESHEPRTVLLSHCERAGRLNSVAEEIARYLRYHPEAADSLHGIRQWWLPQVRLHEATAQVEEALQELLGHGVIVREVMPDGTVLYRRSKTDAPER
jgi:hypothetical protein